MQRTLRKKKLTKTIKREEAENIRHEIKEGYNAPWSFQVITKEGLRVAKYLDENYHLIAKKMLTDKV